MFGSNTRITIVLFVAFLLVMTNPIDSARRKHSLKVKLTGPESNFKPINKACLFGLIQSFTIKRVAKVVLPIRREPIKIFFEIFYFDNNFFVFIIVIVFYIVILISFTPYFFS